MKPSALEFLSRRRRSALAALQAAQKHHKGRGIAGREARKAPAALLQAEMTRGEQPRLAGRFARPDQTTDHPTLF